MNRYTRQILAEFTSAKNRDSLLTTLVHRHSDARAIRFLEANLGRLMNQYTSIIIDEINMSDPMPGMSITSQVHGFNDNFIAYLEETIRELFCIEDASLFTINDGLPTGRHAPSHYAQNPDDILKSWLRNTSRGVQFREDPAGDMNVQARRDNLTSGITFCDQSNIGVNRHIDMYETSYMNALNRGLPHEDTPFGVSTPAADARLLSRSIFRKNEAGIENGISRHQARLHNRYLERDIAETLPYQERDFMIRGYDMSELHRRIDYKNAQRARQVPRHSRLYKHSAQLPNELRYG